MNNPKIAIAVYVENGGFGAVYGVPIGRLMIEKYLKVNSRQKMKSWLQRFKTGGLIMGYMRGSVWKMWTGGPSDFT